MSSFKKDDLIRLTEDKIWAPPFRPYAKKGTVFRVCMDQDQYNSLVHICPLSRQGKDRFGDWFGAQANGFERL